MDTLDYPRRTPQGALRGRYTNQGNDRLSQCVSPILNRLLRSSVVGNGNNLGQGQVKRTYVCLKIVCSF